MDFLREVEKLAKSAQVNAQQAIEKAGEVLDDAKQATSEAIQSSWEKAYDAAEQFTASSKTATSQSLLEMNQAIDQINTSAVSLGAASLTLANALKDLPQTAEELAREMPKIAYRLRNGAGVRTTDLPRTDAEVMKLFEKIPATSKLGHDPQTTIRQFLSDKHGSHITPHAKGGSNEANNIVWEVGVDNIRRGAQAMTGGEQIYIRIYNAVDSIVRNSGAIAQMGVAVTMTATLTQVTVVAIAYSLDLYRGDITVEEYKELLLETIKRVGLSTPIVFLVLIAVLALFPEFALLLSAPAVVAGLNALLGFNIAVPIIQSLIRHLDAGGFGQEVTDHYHQLRDGVQNYIDQSIDQLPRLNEAD